MPHKQPKDFLFIVVITALFAIALGLGYLTYQKFFAKEKGGFLGKNGGGFEYSRLDPSINIGDLGISKEEAMVLSPPLPGASEEERQAHLALAETVSKEAEYLDITKCRVASPVVLRVTYGSTFTVRNNDEVAHELIRSPKDKFSVPPKGEITLTANWGDGPGVYGYGCDSIRRPVGMILMIPE